MQAAKSRCQNENDPSWKNYGGRGIRFCFTSVIAACVWVLKEFGEFDRSLEIDRKDNDGDYRPGNIKLSTKKENLRHTRRTTVIARIHKFRQLHPSVTYSDRALTTFFRKGMTANDVLAHMHSGPRRKPRARRSDAKPGSSTYSTPDPEVASRCKEF